MLEAKHNIQQQSLEEKVNLLISEKEDQVEKLQEEIAELKTVLVSRAILQKYNLHDDAFSNSQMTIEMVLENQKKPKPNDAEVVKHIIKYSPYNPPTKEIIEQYAERMNSTFEKVRPFVDAALSRLVKEEVLERLDNPNGRGSVYRMKN